MGKDKEKNGTCCSCEADFKKEVDELVEEAKKPTAEEHKEKEKELKEAFEEKKK